MSSTRFDDDRHRRRRSRRQRDEEMSRSAGNRMAHGGSTGSTQTHTQHPYQQHFARRRLSRCCHARRAAIRYVTQSEAKPKRGVWMPQHVQQTRQTRDNCNSDSSSSSCSSHRQAVTASVAARAFSGVFLVRLIR